MFDNLCRKIVCNSNGNAAMFILVYIVICGVVLGTWTDRSLDWWLTWIKETPTNCPWYISLLIAMFGPAIILFNCVTELTRFVL